MSIQKRIIEERKNKGVKQNDLAVTLGKPRTLLSKIEHGKIELTTTKLMEIAKALNTEPGYLLTGKHSITIENHNNANNTGAYIADKIEVSNEKFLVAQEQTIKALQNENLAQAKTIAAQENTIKVIAEEKELLKKENSILESEILKLKKQLAHKN